MKDCCPPKAYPDHSTQLKRLNRIVGQLTGVQKMIAERRHCPDILTQLRAIRAAVQAVAANILEDHLAACVGDAFRSGGQSAQQEKIREIIKLFKRFDAD